MSEQTSMFEIQTSTKGGGDYKKYFVPDGTGKYHEVDLDVENHVAVPGGDYGVEITALSKPFQMTGKGQDGKPYDVQKMRAELTVVTSQIPGWEGHRTSVLIPAQDATPGNTLGKILTAATGRPIDGSPINILDALIGSRIGMSLKYQEGNPNPNAPGTNYPSRNGFDWKKIVPFDQIVVRSAPTAPPPRPAAAVYAQPEPQDDVPF